MMLSVVSGQNSQEHGVSGERLASNRPAEGEKHLTGPGLVNISKSSCVLSQDFSSKNICGIYKFLHFTLNLFLTVVTKFSY